MYFYRSCAFQRCAKRAFFSRLTLALDPHKTRWVDVLHVLTVGNYYYAIVYVRKCGGKRTFRLPRSMEVKVVRLSESHVMRVPRLPSPERTPQTRWEREESKKNIFRAVLRDPIVFNHRVAPLRRRKYCNSRPWHTFTSQVIIFEKIHVEDARNHAHHRRRNTSRMTTNEASLENA